MRNTTKINKGAAECRGSQRQTKTVTGSGIWNKYTVEENVSGWEKHHLLDSIDTSPNKRRNKIYQLKRRINKENQKVIDAAECITSEHYSVVSTKLEK